MMSQVIQLNHIERLGIWLAASALWAATLAWLAFQIQQDGVAPAVLFPLVVGGALGAGNLGIVRFTRAPAGRTALVGAVAWGLLVVVGQDYIGHRYHLREYEVALARHDPSLAEALAQEHQLRPTFAHYLAGRVSARPAWWAVDLLCTAGAAALVTALGARKTRLTYGNEA
jgi:hypothetical protein